MRLTNHERERRYAEAVRGKKEYDQHSKAIQVNPILDNFIEAYTAVYNQPPSKVEYRNGWVIVTVIKYASKMRLKDIVLITSSLWAQVHEQELNIPEQSL